MPCKHIGHSVHFTIILGLKEAGFVPVQNFLSPHIERLEIYIYIYIGENSQISRFGKICGKLTLFQKYLAINHFFSTQVPRCVASMALLTWKLCN